MSIATVNIPTQVSNHANLAAFPVTGVLKTIYIAEDTNLEYRWTGSTYQALGAAGSGVQSVTGDGVDNTDPLNPILTFPTPSEIGLGNVDNTSDANKPVSTAQATAIGLKEDAANKSTSQLDIASSTKFPVWSAVVTYVASLGYLLSSTAASTYQAILTGTNFGTFLTGLTGKTSPVNADEFVISDSAASNVAKKVTGTNLKAFLKTYFDSIYTTTSAVASQISTALSGYATTTYADTKLKFTATFRTSSANPADATNYFLGLLPGQAVASVETQRRSKFPVTGTVTDVCFTIQQTNNGSNEAVTITLRNITTATDYTIGKFTSDFGASTVVSFIYTGLTIPVGNTTDYWTLKINAITWATNPTAWLIAADCNVR